MLRRGHKSLGKKARPGYLKDRFFLLFITVVRFSNTLGREQLDRSASVDHFDLCQSVKSNAVSVFYVCAISKGIGRRLGGAVTKGVLRRPFSVAAAKTFREKIHQRVAWLVFTPLN